jgi:hypothetical protein
MRSSSYERHPIFADEYGHIFQITNPRPNLGAFLVLAIDPARLPVLVYIGASANSGPTHCGKIEPLDLHPSMVG